MIEIRLASVKEVADTLGVDYTTVVNLIDAGELAAVDLAVSGRKRRLKVRWHSVEALICRRRIQPKSWSMRPRQPKPYRQIV